MFPITTFISKIIAEEKNNLVLFAPVFVGFGAIFYFAFEENFCAHFVFFVALFVAAILCGFLERYSLRQLVFTACALFLIGSFYGFFYQKFFLNHTPVTGKIYVDVVGKIVGIQKFYNSANGVSGANLLIAEPKMYKSKFDVKAKKFKTKKKKKKKKPTQKKKSKRQQKCEELALEKGEIPDCEKKRKPKKTKKIKPKKFKKISTKIIEKNFVNLNDFQEIDREFLDYSKNYQQVEWLKIKDRELYPNPPSKISINLIKNFSALKVNDLIAVRAMLQPPKSKEFPDDFDFKFDAKFKKIGAYGFAIGEAKVLREARISSADEWFDFLREKVRSKILNAINGDEAGIVMAFLIGDQSQVSSDMMTKIRSSGLAHLLSISGFHLSLAGAICFVCVRFLLSRSEYLALNFDLKKISAIVAIFGTYFYLQIAAAPISAQRAFLMILLVLIALFLGERINAKRSVACSALILILLNPYVVFNISFQLSFIAILVLVNFSFYKKRDLNRHFLLRFFDYFFEIILVSILIQITTAPFLMRSFQNLAILGFVTNIVAIPLTSFVVMPLGFLALFLMPFAAEKIPLILMKHGIILIEKIADFVAAFELSHWLVPQFSSCGLIIAVVGLSLILLSSSYLRYVGILVFVCSFMTIFFVKKPDILFEGRQKFFAIYEQNSLIFSKYLKPSKQRQLWMNKAEEKKFKTFLTAPQKNILCDEKKCVLNKEKRILVLLKRNKISEICAENKKNNFDVVVNLTKKYELPDCFNQRAIKIDNQDFYQKGGHFIRFKEGNISLRTTF